MNPASANGAAVLELMRRPITSPASLVNSVRRSDLPAEPLPRGFWRRLRARRLARRPAAARIEFRKWAATPWRDRPDEARLADVAAQIANGIAQHPAWAHPILEDQRLQLDPAREGAEIACAAYRLYLQRPSAHRRGAQLPASTGPSVADSAAPAALPTLPASGTDSWTAGWQSLLGRVAALLDYRASLDALTPLLAAADARLQRELEPGTERESALFAASAGDDLAADRLRALAAGVDGLGRALQGAHTPTEGASPDQTSYILEQKESRTTPLEEAP